MQSQIVEDNAGEVVLFPALEFLKGVFDAEPAPEVSAGDDDDYSFLQTLSVVEAVHAVDGDELCECPACVARLAKVRRCTSFCPFTDVHFTGMAHMLQRLEVTKAPSVACPPIFTGPAIVDRKSTFSVRAVRLLNRSAHEISLLEVTPRMLGVLGSCGAGDIPR